MIPHSILQILLYSEFIIFAAALVKAGITVLKLRNTSVTYNARLLPFAYLSLSSWIMWALQYVFLVANPFISFPSGFFLKTGLWLGLMQNALWTIAVLCLYSREFSRISETVPLFKIFPIVVVWALLTYQIAVLDSETFIYIDAVAAAVISIIFAYSIWQWRLSKISTWVFLLHGFVQSIWRSIWFTPWTEKQIAILLVFPLGRIALLIMWFRLISAMLQRAQPSYQAVRDIGSLAFTNPLDMFEVMISSTVDDLTFERDAAERAILGLHFTNIRYEAFGSIPRSPQAIRNSLARRCHIFILIIGERYGHIIKSIQKSVIEYEYEVAYMQNPRKILVYVKDRVDREQRLAEFLKLLQVSQRGCLTSFTTPEDLYEKIQLDIARWLTSHAKP